MSNAARMFAAISFFLASTVLDATSPAHSLSPFALAQVDAVRELEMLDELRAKSAPPPSFESADATEAASPRSSWHAATDRTLNGSAVSSDLPAALLKQWRIGVVARVVGRDRQAITVRFTPRQQRDDQQQHVDLLLTRIDDRATPVRVNLSNDSRLVMLLDRVDPDHDSVSITLEGEEIAGQPFQRDTLPVTID